MTVDADWEVEYRGLTVDGGTYSLVSVPEGLIGGIEVRTSDQPRVARHGDVAGLDYLGGRAITLQVEVAAPNDPAGFNTALAAFALAFALGQDEAPLTFRIPGIAGGEVARVNARPRRLNVPVGWEFYHRIPIATVELYACDPYIYAETSTTTNIALPQAPGGFSFPLTFDLDFGSVGGPTTITVTNTGGAVAYPTVRIIGPVTDPSLRNETVDKEVTVGIAIADGEWLDIDFLNRTVLLNGTANRYSYLTTADWWGLEPGANSIRFSALEYSASTAVIQHRSAWL